jgi:hypothetical protein
VILQRAFLALVLVATVALAPASSALGLGTHVAGFNLPAALSSSPERQLKAELPRAWEPAFGGLASGDSFAPDSGTSRQTGSLPDWLKKHFVESEDFNRVNRPSYPYNEVEVVDSAGNTFRVDSFDPDKGRSSRGV